MPFSAPPAYVCFQTVQRSRRSGAMLVSHLRTESISARTPSSLNAVWMPGSSSQCREALVARQSRAGQRQARLERRLVAAADSGTSHKPLTPRRGGSPLHEASMHR
ncbi:hypothetical protein AURDEDRAFT_117823 [Auricularia subglabra TFB-10046 SS5]|uniref:Uncharacterized protein n=1 Tax=Auricularia subglabra (strain TFB-10046 / SS5) TaxID=717982 RepID=J0LBC6_AURST|nr:hypothetical protein AURDEDRAFT_117823 [Auricularia subglabra TFB-10046 SS5]